MAKLIRYTCLFIPIVFYHLGFAAEPQPEPQIITHAQDPVLNAYDIELLQLALDLTQDEYGKAIVKRRVYKQLLTSFEHALVKREFDVAFMPSSAQRERRLRAIKIPLTQGMLSYRVLVVRKDKARIFENVQTLEPFQNRLFGCVGIRWQTINMYNQNRMLMKAAYKKSELYTILVAGEADYFPRGANEVLLDSKVHSEAFKHLTVSPDVALFYMTPKYVFVPYSSPKLAERIEKGLLKALADGSFNSIFIKHFQNEIDMFKKLKVKRVIYVENPKLVVPTPIQWHWWLGEAPNFLRSAN